MKDQKSALRAHLLYVRQTMENRESKQHQIIDHLVNRMSSLPDHTVVGGYQAIQGEVDLTPLWHHPLAVTKWAMPTVKGDNLVFRSWGPEDPLIIGPFGILQPPASAPEVTPDILLTPCIGVDAAGYRLGYGRGYYDRYLAQHPCLAIGIVFDAQKIIKLPREIHDHQLHEICSETGIYTPVL